MTMEYGIKGGGVIYRLGTREFVRSFFIAIDKYVLNEKLYRKIDWSLITDQLYRRTITHEMLAATIAKMAWMLHLMKDTPLSNVDWRALGIPKPDKIPVALKESGPSLRDLYLPFEFALVGCASMMKFDEMDGEPGRPLRIGCCEPQIFIAEDARPPEDYEALGINDLPFWLRDDLEYAEINIHKVVFDGKDQS